MQLRIMTFVFLCLLSSQLCNARQADSSDQWDLGELECVYLGIANSERRFSPSLSNSTIDSDCNFLYLNGGGRVKGKVTDLTFSRLTKLRLSEIRAIDLKNLLDGCRSFDLQTQKAWKFAPLNQLPVANLVAPHSQGRFFSYGPLAPDRALFSYSFHPNGEPPKSPSFPEGLYQVVDGRTSLLLATAPDLLWVQQFRIVGHTNEYLYICMIDATQQQFDFLKINYLTGAQDKICSLPIGRDYQIQDSRFDANGNAAAVEFNHITEQNSENGKRFEIDLKKSTIAESETAIKRPNTFAPRTDAIRDHDPQLDYIGHQLLDSNMAMKLRSQPTFKLPSSNSIARISPATGQEISNIAPPAGYLFTDRVYVSLDGRMVAIGMKIPDSPNTRNKLVDSAAQPKPKCTLLMTEPESERANVVANLPEFMQPSSFHCPVNSSDQIMVDKSAAYFVASLPEPLIFRGKKRRGACGIFRHSFGDPKAD